MDDLFYPFFFFDYCLLFFRLFKLNHHLIELKVRSTPIRMPIPLEMVYHSFIHSFLSTSLFLFYVLCKKNEQQQQQQNGGERDYFDLNCVDAFLSMMRIVFVVCVVDYGQ